jgi:acetyl-CoA carboxylase biotin carboxylase subunit
VQRRYQKLIEETPAPGMPPLLRQQMLDSAVRLGQRLAYRGAGTVEFLFDEPRQAFYFLEVNARIQVEHPVTEMVTGVDLVAEQIRVANGEGLSLTQDQVRFDGAAIECRINAEDPMRDFAPSPGVVRQAAWPAGDEVRIDTHIVSGAKVPPFYDSLLAKLIAHGPDRPSAIATLRQALAQTRIEGVAANVGFHLEVLADPEFQAGGVDTGYLARFLARAPALTEA